MIDSSPCPGRTSMAIPASTNIHPSTLRTTSTTPLVSSETTPAVRNCGRSEPGPRIVVGGQAGRGSRSPAPRTARGSRGSPRRPPRPPTGAPRSRPRRRRAAQASPRPRPWWRPATVLNIARFKDRPHFPCLRTSRIAASFASATSRRERSRTSSISRTGSSARSASGPSAGASKGRNIALIFEKSSTRTRCAFEVAAADQGANTTTLHRQLRDRTSASKESMRDTARVLGRLYDGIEYRGHGQRYGRGACPSLRGSGVERTHRRVPPDPGPRRPHDHARAPLLGTRGHPARLSRRRGEQHRRPRS